MFSIFLKKTGFRKVTDRFIKQGIKLTPNKIYTDKILTDVKTDIPLEPYIEKEKPRKSKLDIPDGTYIH